VISSPAVLLFIPTLYLAAALLPDRLFGGSVRRRWALSLAVVSVPPIAALVAIARIDATTAVMLLLVTSIAAIILRFSRRYLGGEPNQARYVRWFLATIASVSLLVVTNNLLVLGVAWLASSLTMHQLLTFYDARPQALIAAHKKFLLGRVADVAIFAAIALVWRATGTLTIGEITARFAAMPTVPATMQLAGLLLAAGVVIRSAQLPFHGWLIQVMEAPTPVSALLHAGIVNIGGFVLIRLAGVMVRLDAAQTLLVIAGTITAVLAALVMTTRVSVKVSLAWSTGAQMGFMLLECGLGAYGLALLHLAAHSLYKAHAFLSSGSAVERQLLRTMAPARTRSPLGHWALAAVAGAVVVGVAGTIAGVDIAAEPDIAVIGLILALALAPLFLRGLAGKPAQLLFASIVAVALTTLYAGWHALFATLLPVPDGTATASALRLGIVGTGFVLLYAVQAVIAARPNGRFARAFYPACFAGFYLDEIMTRITFKVWPPRPVHGASAFAAQQSILGLTRFDGHVGYAARAECAKRSCSYCTGLT
jgi:NAD(P)H-quinone oxidoreductase subunit 5